MVSHVFSAIRTRRSARLTLTTVAVLSQFVIVALAGSPSNPTAANRQAGACGSAATCSYVRENGLVLTLPENAKPCSASLAVAACLDGDDSVKATPGSSTTPAGLLPCPGRFRIGGSPASAACTEVALTAPGQQGDPSTSPTAPSVPIRSLRPGIGLRLDLSTDSPSPVPGQNVVLVATAGASVTGTGDAIEIFDMTTHTLVGGCAAGSQCIVAYSAKSGTHTFQAIIAAPTKDVPSSPLVMSNQLNARWMAVSIVASSVGVGPGKPVTITATSSISFSGSPYVLQIYDVNTNARVASCSKGVSCSVTIRSAQAGVRNFIADLASPSATFPAPDAQAQSQLLPIAWLAVSLQGNTNGQVGGPVYLTATANGDLTNTPWSIGIFDDQGHLVAPPCKNGNICTVQVALPPGDTPHYTAEIGAVPPAPKPASSKLGKLVQALGPTGPLTEIQAKSAAVQPTRLLWGVDSCKSFTQDPNGRNGLYPQVVSSLGTPDFWGRYLTNTVCPGISWTEVSAAFHNHMGILPIYDDYDCSAVAGYATGQQYAASATAAAQYLHIPAGRALAVDIEPPGDACPGAMYIDAGFIHGWYDGVTAAHYVPVYYGNGTGGSYFAASWCVAAIMKPALMTNAFVWSFEPSVQGSSRSSSPGYSPYNPGCGANVAVWQYALSGGGSNPDIDYDEAITSVPLWYPTPW